MSWQDILKVYELSDNIKNFLYVTEIKPRMYEFLSPADDSVKDFKTNNPEGFELYLNDIFDYITSHISKEELYEFYREMSNELEEEWYDEDEKPYDPRKIRRLIYKVMNERQP
jgi:ribosomal protein L11 methylase PrmA|tara:strand:+ start:178 stop:516 length:339 start_codon:yes stop_codon:yes gene_type:complete